MKILNKNGLPYNSVCVLFAPGVVILPLKAS